MATSPVTITTQQQAEQTATTGGCGCGGCGCGAADETTESN